ncbi:hypothetical protein EJB05_21390 [Eragrostis curvula]|uniref:Uncharacterized protein n=1 Tax=Eragrostis curvula TaxID=38414 RepID=A0A5J9V1D4_9POAL|nr:hypothetical protein EJB05_21390 [Eragrostis curvula]
MSDLSARRPPTAAEVVERIKDDGDFDTLRRAIIRKVKENEALRNTIISEVKQSLVLQEDGSEKLKLKDLSDAVFQDIGSKIMGQISDEVWSVIQSNGTDIQGTVQAVYNRIVHPEKDTHPSSKKRKSNGKEERVPLAKPASVTVEVDDDDPEEPPGFGFSNNQHNNVTAATTQQQQQQPSNLENHKEMRPNEGEPVAVSSAGDCNDDDGPDVPPGFG